MNQEFEIISHSQMNFKLFLVNMLYRTPHIHKDFELCLLLDGSLFLQAQNETHSLETGDFFVVNPFQSHELKADSPALLVSLQVHPSFFLLTTRGLPIWNLPLLFFKGTGRMSAKNCMT